MLSIAGPFKEFGLVAIAPSPNYSQTSHMTVPGHTVIDPGSLPFSPMRRRLIN
jgi:hypothetical protein